MKKQLVRDVLSHPYRPEKILQFGEGNFLRAFIDWQFDLLNEHTAIDAGITIVRPIDSTHTKLDTQNGIYTALIRGLDENGKPVAQPRLITSVNREILAYGEYEKVLKVAENPHLEWIVSNTTEAGICFDGSDKLDQNPPSTFPAKLTQFLFHRFEYFKGNPEKGLVLLPCELIDNNGAQLKSIVLKYSSLWNLGNKFIDWINNSNTFCSTLVDRIVTGYPKDEINTLEEQLGYQDQFLVTAEYFYLFIIQGPSWLKDKLQMDKYPLNIKIVDDIKPYKERKVGILNGAHTAMVPVAYLAGLNTVKEAIDDNEIFTFVNTLLNSEIIPSLDMPADELMDFKESVLFRFKNPYIKHYLLSIALNSITKFKTRLLPQLLTYAKTNDCAPGLLSFSLAALYCFYLGQRDGQDILQDNQIFIDMFKRWKNDDSNQSENIIEFLSMSSHWGYDLTNIPNLVPLMTEYVTNIQNKGIRQALREIHSI
ncbi:tagaturonate reductase [Vibrio salinus]|uniref:tagaturonate reductase n=1 Tax=Vibrio salinus TaxID=2899784 RepID=UPI001E4A5969|nr:tagaturonate reductase [Vibrio salinus]MCE0492424.1 tagaturonate reductase [Vibrio salinus]